MAENVITLNMLKQGWYATPEQKIQAIIHEVNKLPIEQVLSDHGVVLERQIGKRILALCPFHMDENIGSFSINTDKNSCWCYACNSGGGIIKSMMQITGKDEIETALIVAADENIITPEMYQELSGQKYDASFLDKKENNFSANHKKEKVRPIGKTQKLWNDVYMYMKNWFGLSEDDRIHLSQERNLSQERIQADYFSLDIDDKSVRNKFLYHLRNQFKDTYSLEDLGSVPGFFLDKYKKDENYRLQMLTTSGIGILIKDANNNIIGVQIRDSNPDAAVRYKFLSFVVSKNNTFSKGGGTCGTPIDVLYPDVITENTKLAVVEGKFKSEILCKQGMISLAVQGVNNYNDIDKDIKAVEQHIGHKISSVYVFYDADKTRNLQVYKAEMNLAHYIKEKRPDLNIISSVWNTVYGKGVDDCIFNGYRNEIKFYNTSDMEKLMNKAIDVAVKKAHIDVNNLAKTSKADRIKFLDFFEEYIKVCLQL